jgi:hypothetical protein
MEVQVTHLDEGMKHVLDLASITTVLGALMGMLPSIAAGFTIVWTGIRIYETKTVQRGIAKLKEKFSA